MIKKEILKLIERVQSEFYTRFSFEELKNAALLAKRKCEINRKSNDYFPLMFENELRNLAMRNIINRLEGA